MNLLLAMLVLTVWLLSLAWLLLLTPQSDFVAGLSLILWPANVAFLISVLDYEVCKMLLLVFLLLLVYEILLRKLGVFPDFLPPPVIYFLLELARARACRGMGQEGLGISGCVVFSGVSDSNQYEHVCFWDWIKWDYSSSRLIFPHLIRGL